MKHKNIFIILCLLSCITISCRSGKKLSNQNVAFIYKKDSLIDPGLSIVHLNDTVSELHVQLRTDQLLYKATATEELIAQVKIEFILYSGYEGEVLIDSSTIIIKDVYYEDAAKKIITDKFDLKVPFGQTYVMVCTFTDINRNRSRKFYQNIDKSSHNSRQYFYVSQEDDNESPVIKNHFSIGEKIKIFHTYINARQYFVRYYNRDFSIAAPPFASVVSKPFDYKADSIFVIDVIDNQAVLEISKQGFYHIQIDTTINKEGLTIFSFQNNSYPEIKTLNDLLQPLRYITSKQEYDDLNASDAKKELLDKFWITGAGNPDRAKELISNYYNRVQLANTYFTSYLEGWKTDRGMIYIIFGPPNIIYKAADRENWIYGEENNLMSLNFNFFLVTNPFTEKDYLLDRSIVYKNNWYRAVDTWRQGRVY
jgi:GWxTD domain-containing protein